MLRRLNQVYLVSKQKPQSKTLFKVYRHLLKMPNVILYRKKLKTSSLFLWNKYKSKLSVFLFQTKLFGGLKEVHHFISVDGNLLVNNKRLANNNLFVVTGDIVVLGLLPAFIMLSKSMKTRTAFSKK